MLNCFCLTRPKMPKYISRFITRIRNVIVEDKHLSRQLHAEPLSLMLHVAH